MDDYTERSTNMECAQTDVDTVNISSLMQALERINNLVGPAKVEITRLADRHRAPHGSTAIAELQSQLDETRGEKETLNKQFELNNQAYNAKCAELERNLQHAIEKFNELQISAKKQEQLLIAKNEEKLDAFKDVIQRTESELQGAIKEKEKALKSFEDLKVKAQHKIQQQKTENEQLKRSLTQLKAEKERIEKDLSDTKSRLSKLMGDKLSDKNPDIADLSDNNRPTKLAEQYQEIYDNEWTDAFEVAEKFFPGKEESFRIQKLLKILMEVYKFCEREFENQDKELMQAMYRSNPQTTRQDLPDNLRAQLKEIKRLTATGAIENLKKKYFEEVNTAEKVEGFSVKVKTYVKDCINLCWMMVRQDPPLVLHKDVEIGDQFDSNKYRPYTSTGTIVEFVVWPALFLHQDGPLLSKGVVQCINQFQGSKSMKARSRPVDKLTVVSSASMRLTGYTTNKFLDENHNTKSNTHTESFASEQTQQKVKTPYTATVNPGNKNKFSKENSEEQQSKHTSQDKNNQTQHMIQSKENETDKGFGFKDPAHSKQNEIRPTETLTNDQSTAATLQNSKSTGGSHSQRESVTTDNEMNRKTPSNYQHNQPTGSVLESFDPLASQRENFGPNVTGKDQNQSSTLTYTAANQQRSQSTYTSSNADQEENQYTLVPFYWQAIQLRCPDHLIPTNGEYQRFVNWNNIYGPDQTRFLMGEQLYDKCNNYLLWAQSLQFHRN